MKLPQMRMKIWELATAVAVVALMLWVGVGWLKAHRKGAPIILAGYGFELRIHTDDPTWHTTEFGQLTAHTGVYGLRTTGTMASASSSEKKSR